MIGGVTHEPPVTAVPADGSPELRLFAPEHRALVVGVVAVVLLYRKGFGTTLIRDVPRHNLEATVTLDYAPGGVRWALDAGGAVLAEQAATGPSGEHQGGGSRWLSGAAVFG